MFTLGGGPKNFSVPPLSEDMPGDNFTTPGTEYAHIDHPGHTFVHVAEAVIQPVLLAIGIITNILSLVVLKRTHIVSVFKICIVSLTISDFLASLFGFAQIVVEVVAFNGNIPFGYYYPAAIASHSLYYIFLMFMCTSSGIVILIVSVRSFMISRPLSSKKYLTSRRLRWMCAGVALITCVLFIPTSLSILWEVCYHDFYQNHVCANIKNSFPNIDWILKYVYALTILYGPILIIVYIACFISIKMNLRKADSAAREMMDPTINSQEFRMRIRQTAKVTNVLLGILVADCVCIIPTCVQGVGLIIAPKSFVFDKTYIPANVFDVICEIFLCCRPTANFVIYVCMHKEFRRKFYSLFGKWAQDGITGISTLGVSKGPAKSAIRRNSYSSELKGYADGSTGSNANMTQSTTVDSIGMTAIKGAGDVHAQELVTAGHVNTVVERISPEEKSLHNHESSSCNATMLSVDQGPQAVHETTQCKPEVLTGDIASENGAIINSNTSENEVIVDKAIDDDHLVDRLTHSHAPEVLVVKEDNRPLSVSDIADDNNEQLDEKDNLDETFDEIDALLEETQQCLTELSQTVPHVQ